MRKLERYSYRMECVSCIEDIRLFLDPAVPMFRYNDRKTYYCHVQCLYLYDGETYTLFDDVAELLKDYHIGHHNLAKRSNGEYLYFWEGKCGTAKSLKEALDALYWLEKEARL